MTNTGDRRRPVEWSGPVIDASEASGAVCQKVQSSGWMVSGHRKAMTMKGINRSPLGRVSGHLKPRRSVLKGNARQAPARRVRLLGRLTGVPLGNGLESAGIGITYRVPSTKLQRGQSRMAYQSGQSKVVSANVVRKVVSAGTTPRRRNVKSRTDIYSQHTKNRHVGIFSLTVPCSFYSIVSLAEARFWKGGQS